MLKVLRKRRDIWHREHTWSCSYQFQGTALQWFSVWSLLAALAVSHLNWEFKLTHKVMAQGRRRAPNPSHSLRSQTCQKMLEQTHGSTQTGQPWITPTAHLLLTRISPCTIPVCFHPFLPGLTSREYLMSWAKGDVCPSLLSPAFASPSVLTLWPNQPGSCSRWVYLGVCMWNSGENHSFEAFVSGDIYEKNNFKKREQNNKKESKQKKRFFVVLTTFIVEQYSSQSNTTQFCTQLCKEIEDCPQKTAWKTAYFPVVSFLLPKLDFKNRNMGFHVKLALTVLPKVLP